MIDCCWQSWVWQKLSWDICWNDECCCSRLRGSFTPSPHLQNIKEKKSNQIQIIFIYKAHLKTTKVNQVVCNLLITITKCCIECSGKILDLSGKVKKHDWFTKCLFSAEEENSPSHHCKWIRRLLPWVKGHSPFYPLLHAPIPSGKTFGLIKQIVRSWRRFTFGFPRSGSFDGCSKAGDKDPGKIF